MGSWSLNVCCSKRWYLGCWFCQWNLDRSPQHFFVYYFLPILQTQTFYHICFSILCLLHNMSSSSVKWLVHYDGQIIKTNERDTFQSPHPLFFETKRGLEKKNLGKALSSTMDQVCNISFSYPQVVGTKCWNLQLFNLLTMKTWKVWFQLFTKLRFFNAVNYMQTRAQYTSHHKPWTSISSTTKLSPVLLFTHIWRNPRHFCFNPTRTKYIWTKHIFFYLTFFWIIFHQFFDSQAFDATEDQSQPYLSTPIVKSFSSTQPNELEFTVKLCLPNKELGPFSDDEDKALQNQL